MKRVSAARRAAVRAGAMLAAGLLMAATLPACDAAEGGKETGMRMLSAGDPAPDFSMPGSDGKTHSLADYKGKQAVVIAWFPKAFTGGWTAECKSLRESGETLRQYDVAYFAASCDDAETNRKFAESLDLDYPILSDPGTETARAYGVLMDNGKYPNRHTVYIGKDGNILLIDREVSPASAGDDVAKHLAELGVDKKEGGS